jgi:dTDP-4-dehydrorhamnose reductase
MVVLVTGARGMLGQAVVVEARRRDHEVFALSPAELNVCDAPAVAESLAALAPDVVVNCAAWTDVDGAEADEAAALECNGVAPGLLAEAANEVGARLIHISTDYVFDGSSPRPYVESDATGPRSAYGRTKLAGELAVQAAGGPHAIARTAWLFGTGGGNFVATMLSLAADGRETVSVVSDQVGCPTFAGHLAIALVEIAERRLAGVMHVAGAGHCSWAELAAEAFSQSGSACRVIPIGTEEFPRAAQRPARSILESERPDTPRLPPWQAGVSAYLTEATQGIAR